MSLNYLGCKWGEQLLNLHIVKTIKPNNAYKKTGEKHSHILTGSTSGWRVKFRVMLLAHLFSIVQMYSFYNERIDLKSLYTRYDYYFPIICFVTEISVLKIKNPMFFGRSLAQVQ